ncbi:MAG: transporter permease [Blastococcus sp.]|jgi:iron(III) transport system permease protein|nr:transporter permease [Blastococcus sp.]
MTALLAAPGEVTPDLPRGERRRRRPSVTFVVAAVCLLVLGYLVLSPLVYLVWRGLTTGEGLSLANIGAAYRVSGSAEMVGNSFAFAFGSAAVSTITGTALAFFCTRTNAPLKPLLYAASLIPLIVPGILFTISWVFLLSDDIGLINHFLRAVGLDFLVVDAFSLPGMILIDGMHQAPLVFLLMFAAFRATDPALEESSLMSGATLPQTLRRVTLPLVRPALAGAVLISVVRGLESFETPAVLGIPANTWVFTSRIFQALGSYPVKYDIASIYSITLLLLTVAGLLFVQRINRRAERYQTISGKGFRPRPMDLGAWRWPVSILFGVYFLVVVLLPLLMLVWMSLLPFYQVPSVKALGSVSLENYTRIFSKPGVKSAIQNSTILALGSATAVMLFMSVVAWLTLKSKIPGRRFFDTIASVPLALPGLVLGVALIFIYLRSPLPIYGTLAILFIAYITRYMPYGMRYASSSLAQVSTELEDSARMSGAGWFDSFRRVVMPLMMPGILAGWVYVMIVSIRELSSSILLYSSNTRVLSVVIWELWANGETGVLAALGVGMVVALMLLVAVVYKLGGRVGVRDA